MSVFSNFFHVKESPILSVMGFGGGGTGLTQAGGATPITASGGNQSPGDGLAPGNGYKYHTFTSSGTFTVTEGTGEIEYLVIGGGGAGGGGYYRIAGGGGAGGLLSNSPEVPTTPVPRGNATKQPAYEVSPGPYTVTIGTGGAGGQVNTGNIQPGSPTNFYPTPVSHPHPTYIRALGGGGGAGNPNPGSNGGGGTPGDPGGSGGGSTESGSTPGLGYLSNGTAGQGSGGVGPVKNPEASGGGGGGGASGTMPDPEALDGHGTNGIQMPSWTGPLIGAPPLGPMSGYWAGGGGGGSNSGQPAPSGQAGLGGGGRGNLWPNSRAPEMPAVANTGGGGGGGVAHENGSPGGGAGGSGIVVIRYRA